MKGRAEQILIKSNALNVAQGRPIRKGGHCPIEVTYLNGELEGKALDDLGREEVPQDEVAVLVAGDDVVPRCGDGGDAVAHGAAGIKEVG